MVLTSIAHPAIGILNLRQKGALIWHKVLRIFLCLASNFLGGGPRRWHDGQGARLIKDVGIWRDRLDLPIKETCSPYRAGASSYQKDSKYARSEKWLEHPPTAQGGFCVPALKPSARERVFRCEAKQFLAPMIKLPRLQRRMLSSARVAWVRATIQRVPPAAGALVPGT